VTAATVIQTVSMLGVTGFIIAGGKSSRMGQEKAFLPLQGKELIEHTLRKVREATEEYFIVGPKDKFMAYGRTVPDQFPGAGPLGGIHAALKRTRTDLSLVLAVDTPFVKTEFLEFLIEQASHMGAMITVPRADGRLQPLCAVYHKDFLAVAEKAIKAGNFRVDAAYPLGRVCEINLDSPSSQEHRFDVSMFANLNTQQDYEAAVTRAERELPAAKVSVLPKTKSARPR
jgi:molybdopterin-guanine dinucleotide biosynthesis protein A